MRYPNRTTLTQTAVMTLALTVAGTPFAMAQSAPAMDTKTTANEASEAPITDSWITTKVKADLLLTEEVKGLDINVSTTNGVVTLAGKLDSQAQVDKATAVAQGIKGVKSVDTKALKVKPTKMAPSAPAMDTKTTANEASEAPITDSWITTKVKADLLLTEEVKGLDINVSTTNGVVTLAGKLDSQAQVDKATAVAQGIKGVKSVDTKALKVKPSK